MSTSANLNCCVPNSHFRRTLSEIVAVLLAEVAGDRAVGLIRTVRGGAQAVGAEPDPGEERDERDVVIEFGVADVPRLAQQSSFEGHGRIPRSWQRCPRDAEANSFAGNARGKSIIRGNS